MPILPSLTGSGGGVSDHGALTGLTDVEDHPSYLLTDGARTLDGNLTVTGTVDGRDVAIDGAKLDGIDTGAQVNADLASQGEAEAGVDNAKTMTPLRVAQAIAALAGGSLLNKFDATVPPTITDDSSAGYSVGSVWIDVVAGEAYRCVNPAVGAAIWINTTLDSSELAAVALSGDSDDLTQGTSNLLMTPTERTKLAGIASDAEANPPVVTQAEAEVGLLNEERSWTPFRVRQSVLANSPAGGYNGTTKGAVPFVDTDLSLKENHDYINVEDNGRTNIKVLAKTISEEIDEEVINFDLSLSNKFTVTLGGNRSLTVSNAKVGQDFRVRLEQDLAGNRTVNWWHTINWPGGTPPVLTATGERADWFWFEIIAENKFDCILRTFNLTTIDPIY